MERLTQERGDRTWRLYHIGWYINLLAVAVVLAAALLLFQQIQSGASEDLAVDTTTMMALVVIAAVLLMGAGISRYQARLEGQHLELKLAIKQLEDKVEALKRSSSQS